MIYIIGIDHQKHQYVIFANEESVFDLKDVIKELLATHDVGLIAEEFSQQVLDDKGIERTAAQEVADNAGIKYLLADPDSKERQALNIRTRQDTAISLGIDITQATEADREKINLNHKDADQQREEEWLRRVMPYIARNIVFVCGFEHAKTLQQLITSKGEKAYVHKILD